MCPQSLSRLLLKRFFTKTREFGYTVRPHSSPVRSIMQCSHIGAQLRLPPPTHIISCSPTIATRITKLNRALTSPPLPSPLLAFLLWGDTPEQPWPAAAAPYTISTGHDLEKWTLWQARPLYRKKLGMSSCQAHAISEIFHLSPKSKFAGKVKSLRFAFLRAFQRFSEVFRGFQRFSFCSKTSNFRKSKISEICSF